jgi:choline dehydrogenase-like flavoprotein
MAKQFELGDSSVVVIIGSGAGGGTLSNELAQKGIDVVCLEAGRRLTLADVDNNGPIMDQKMGWHDKRQGPLVWVCKTVGGTTMRWSGVTPLIQEHEFKALSTYGQFDSGTTFIDWPLTFDELRPYYDKAEDKMGVAGTGDIPHFPETNNYKVMAAGGRRVGYKEITSSRIAINPVARNGRPGCQQIGWCNSGCAIGAKWSTLYTEIPAAELTGHFELRTETMAMRINHDAKGHVSGVVYKDKDGNLQEQKARGVRCRQRCRNHSYLAEFRVVALYRWPGQLHRQRRQALYATHLWLCTGIDAQTCQLSSQHAPVRHYSR